VKDGPNESGDMFERPGRPADRFPSPFPNAEAAKAANGGAVPPDFSVIAKARTYERGFPMWLIDIFTQYQAQGVDYITALLMGYEAPPKGVTVEPGLHWNKYFPGNKIAMANPLIAVIDENGKPNDPGFYTDGTPVTREQVARDVSAFLMWAAEPHMEERKRLGAKVMLWLIVLAGLLYFTKKRIWSRLEGAH
jgi:ubiquinol-cytochrome c reductase cytochrome b/c1 subunit